MESINFLENWNKKLYCQAFTTIRKPHPKYVNGQHVNVFLNGTILKECKIIAIESAPSHAITEREARIDSGLSKRDLTEFLKTVYKPYPENLYILTLLTVKEYEDERIKLFNTELRKLADQLEIKKA